MTNVCAEGLHCSAFHANMMITMLLLLLFCVIQVMRTCKEVGIKTVAIYSDADAQAVSTEFACMHPFAMETSAILVHSLMLIVHQNGRRGSCQAVAML